MSDAIVTRPMTDDDVGVVVELLDRALGPAPGGTDRRALFEWKHLANPFGRSIALVAELDRRIVGFRSFMRWELASAGGRISAVRAVDTATDPGVQRRGIFSRLTLEGLDVCRGAGADLVFNTPNDRSRPGYLKMGWRVVGTCGVWVKARRPLRITAAVVRRDLRSGAAVEVPAGSRLEPVAEALARASTIAREAREPAGLHVPRTQEYLSWRYAAGPIPYHAWMGDGAVVIGRLRARGALREAVVTEALAAAGAEGELRTLLARFAREAGADHAAAHFGPGWDARASLAGAGYRRLPRAGMVLTARSLEEGDPDPPPVESWSLSLGELEVF